MPVRFVILKPYNVIYLHFEGEITLVELLQLRAAVAADPDFKPSLAEMIDLRTANLKNLSIGDIRLMAISTLFEPGARRALIAPTDVQFVWAQLFGDFVGSPGQNVQVFRTVEEACEWLGVPVEALA